jgi:hypothetical protein
MPNTAYINDLPRMKYHLGYWKIGNSADQIQTCKFHSAFIDGFIEKFSGLGKYTVLYLKCLSDGRVLIDRRETWNDKSLQSLIEDLKTVDLDQ